MPLYLTHRALGLIGTLFLGACTHLPVEQDPWTGPDKLAHLTASAAISAAYSKQLADKAPDHQPRLRAVGLTLGLGGLKELGDSQVAGKGWSWKDMAWNLAGALLGHELVRRQQK